MLSITIDPNTKYCPQCRAFIDKSQFHKKTESRDGLMSYCKFHNLEKTKSYRLNKLLKQTA